jgi:ABC-type phosphate transport system substrate-binding protein
MKSNVWSTTKLLILASRIAFAASLCLFSMLAIEADAQYAPNIQGGGASLPAPTYRQNFNCYAMPLTNPPDPAADTYIPPECSNAAYPIDSTKIFRYSSVGSGRGQCMYLTHDTLYNNDASRALSEVNFAGSDAKLTQNQVNTFTAGGALGSEASACSGRVIPAQAPIYGPLIMIPSLATPITLAISPDTALALNILPNIPAGGTSGLTFSRAGYCKMLTGQITDWNSADADFISQNIDPVSGVPQPFSVDSLPLRVVYRSDGSGTTFLFTQHMTSIQAACSSTLYKGAAETMPPGLPANFTGASGSGGAEAAILGADHVGNIGYLSPDFTAQSNVVPAHPAVTANLVNAANVVQPPSPQATTAGMGNIDPPTGAARSNPLNWVPLVADPGSPNAYPMVGYTTQEFYTCYNMTSGADVKANGILGYLTWALSSPDGVPDLVLNDNGFAPLPPAWKGAILDTFVTGDVNNLQIRVGPVPGVCKGGA